MQIPIYCPYLKHYINVLHNVPHLSNYEHNCWEDWSCICVFIFLSLWEQMFTSFQGRFCEIKLFDFRVRLWLKNWFSQLKALKTKEVVLLFNLYEDQSEFGHFGWSSLHQRAVWGLRLGFRVKVRITFCVYVCVWAHVCATTGHQTSVLSTLNIVR